MNTHDVSEVQTTISIDYANEQLADGWVLVALCQNTRSQIVYVLGWPRGAE